MMVRMVQQSLVEDICELQTRIEEQDQRIATLERQLQALNRRRSPCPRCDQGEMVRNDDRVHCSSCDYARSL